jgi:hypothetical protein
MRAEVARAVRSLIDAQVASRPSPIEYEMAYQARIAIDRIRFAITQIEKIGSCPDVSREVNLQLLDALDRLKEADLKFQDNFRRPRALETIPNAVSENGNGCQPRSNVEAMPK